LVCACDVVWTLSYHVRGRGHVRPVSPRPEGATGAGVRQFRSACVDACVRAGARRALGPPGAWGVVCTTETETRV
jgi:hypothetical protein